MEPWKINAIWGITEARRRTRNLVVTSVGAWERQAGGGTVLLVYCLSSLIFFVFTETTSFDPIRCSALFGGALVACFAVVHCSMLGLAAGADVLSALCTPPQPAGHPALTLQ